MTNEAKEQEIWKTYPKYPFVEVSNLGRARTKDRYVTVKGRGKRLVKGRILKQYLQKNGYMFVNFKVNGKQINLLIHRMVAITFIPSPNNYLEVNHIDNDPTNNAISNLEWCTRKYNEDCKKKFGTSQAELFGHPVFVVDLKIGKILRFESQHEAARQLGVGQGNINSVIKGKLYQIGGYWFTEDESEITEEKIQEIKEKMELRGCVIAINIETSGVLWFESQSEAARQLSISRGNINEVIKGKRNKAKGFWFCYADEDALEKTRSKFGDKVADKVEKLLNERKII